jgi:2-amino-4-hydroxy-6-hydroxymethyldihydropteridine diphosphokinase
MGQPVVAYIGLGSNLQNPASQLQQALQALAAIPACRLLSHSSLYGSAPMGPQDQPDYVNAVAALKTSLTAEQLLDQLQGIENHQGRVRKERWGARTLDLDLLLFGDQIINTERLVVPHVGIAERSFVLYPLQEIAPGLVIPGMGALKDLVKRCPMTGLVKLAS